MDSNYHTPRNISPSIQSIPSASASKGQKPGNDVSLLNEISNVVKSFETNVLNAMKNIDNLSKQDTDRIKSEQIQLTRIKLSLNKRSDLPKDKKDELIATINKIHAIYLILLPKEESSPKTPQLKPLNVTPPGHQTTPKPSSFASQSASYTNKSLKVPKDLKYINASIAKLNGNIDSLSSLSKEEKETKIGFIKLELEFLKDDLKNLSSEDRKIPEAKINKCYTKLGLSPPSEHASTSQSQSAPQAKPTIEATSTTAQSPAVAKTVSLLQKMVITDKAQRENDPEYINPVVFLNSYHLVASSEELFQSLSICMNDDKLEPKQKLLFLSFASDWFESGAYDIEFKTNDKINKAVTNFTDTAVNSTDQAVNSAGSKLKLVAQQHDKVKVPRSIKTLESEALAIIKKAANVDEVFKKINTNLTKEQKLERINKAISWFASSENYHLYFSDPEVAKEIKSFIKVNLNTSDQDIKEAALKLSKAQNREGKTNIIGQIAMKSSKEEYKQKIEEFSNDLLIMQANLASNISPSEWYTDFTKTRTETLQKRPNLEILQKTSMNISNFVVDQILGAIEEIKAGNETNKEKLISKRMDKALLKTTQFFLDLAEACYSKGDLASFFSIMTALDKLPISRLLKNINEKNPVIIKLKQLEAKKDYKDRFKSITSVVSERTKATQVVTSPIEVDITNIQPAEEHNPSVITEIDGKKLENPIINTPKHEIFDKIITRGNNQRNTLNAESKKPIKGSLISHLSGYSKLSDDQLYERSIKIR